MLKHALTYWGIRQIEDLDPAVKLILEALSLELYMLGNETKDAQVRILEKIAGLLTPDFLTAPAPAHAILHASPLEPTEWLTNTTSFFVPAKIPSLANDATGAAINVHFTPVDAVKLLDVEIAYLATGNNLFSYGPSFNKQLLLRGQGFNTNNNTLYLGLRVNPKIEHIDNLFFCFDTRNLESKLAQQIYQLLPLAKWYMGDRQLNTSPGLQYETPAHHPGQHGNVFLEYDLLHLMEKDIKNYYHPKYVTISQLDVTAGLQQPWPAAFNPVFSGNDLQKINEKLVWLRIVFPAALQQEHLDELYVYPNAFPVMNKRVLDLKHRLKGDSNIIPLKTRDLEQFLSIKSLSDETRQFRSVPYRKMEEEQTGTYTLRAGGVERFDTRNAHEMISYLLELLRSESAAFAGYGYDFIATTLREMNQKIQVMEQKTKANTGNSTEIPHYLIVKPFEGSDILYAEYWTTLAETANNLRAGTKLQLEKGVKVKQDHLMLITTTIGGKNRLRPEEKVNAFRYGIMTRNRIVTKEDIRNFCFYELGTRLHNVTVEKGIEMGAGPKEGFRKTIDVILSPADPYALKSKEWDLLCEQLHSKLQARSGVSNHYRILVAQDNDTRTESI